MIYKRVNSGHIIDEHVASVTAYLQKCKRLVTLPQRWAQQSHHTFPDSNPQLNIYLVVASLAYAFTCIIIPSTATTRLQCTFLACSICLVTLECRFNLVRLTVVASIQSRVGRFRKYA